MSRANVFNCYERAKSRWVFTLMNKMVIKEPIKQEQRLVYQFA